MTPSILMSTHLAHAFRISGTEVAKTHVMAAPIKTTKLERKDPDVTAIGRTTMISISWTSFDKRVSSHGTPRFSSFRQRGNG